MERRFGMTNKLRFTLFISVTLAALYILGPRVAAVAWHLRYGNQLHPSGATIVVPGRWFALHGKESQSLFTFSPSWSRKIFNFDSITFAPLPSAVGSDAAKQYERWEAGGSDGEFIRLHRVQSTRRFQVDGRRVSCYERTNPMPEASFSVSCMVEGQMVVSFYGNEKDSSEFYKILASTTT